MFKGIKSVIEIDREEGDFVYFKIPELTRVHKIKGVIERFCYGNWRPASLYMSMKPETAAARGKSQPPYWRLAIVNKKVGTRTWAAYKLIATACIPNPNGFEHVIHIDKNTLNDNIENLQWSDSTEAFWNKRRTMLSEEQHNELKRTFGDGRTSKDQAYMKVYNQMKGSDGLTHSERFKQQYVKLGFRYGPCAHCGQWRWINILTKECYSSKEMKAIYGSKSNAKSESS